MEPELMHKPIKNPNLKSTQNYIESRSSEKKTNNQSKAH